MKNRNLILSALVLFLMQGAAQASKIGLAPIIGDGSSGWTVTISGSRFEPSDTYTVTIGGLAASPPSVSSDASGAIPQSFLYFPRLFAGKHDLVLTGTSRVHTFTGAFEVRRSICLSPSSGYGRAGQVNIPTAAIGGWWGMVFRIRGSGFNPNASIAVNSIKVGTASTTHPQIITTADGALPTTTVIVASNLAYGAKDVVINDGTVNTFSGVYRVTRAIGLNPSTGLKNAGTSVTIYGWGFDDGPVGPILVGGKSTTPSGAPVITNGSFMVNVTFDSSVNVGGNDVAFTSEVFVSAYDGIAKGEQLAMSPVVFTGIPNEAFVVQGLANWGADIPADSIGMYDLMVQIAATRHNAMTVSGGAFPPTWVVVSDPLSDGVDRVDATGKRYFYAASVKRTLGICPIYSNGAVGFTTSITGFGFGAGTTIAANSMTFGGTAAGHPAITTGNALGSYGTFGPTLVFLPNLPYGANNVVVSDGTASTFTGMFRARRSIELTRIAGPGTPGETVTITGRGFVPGPIAADSITFGGFTVSHAAITVAADGSFPSTVLTLPVLAFGPHDVNAQQAFTQAYRVYNPVVEISKHRDPVTAAVGQSTTFSFSYTNIAYLGNPPVKSFVLHDTMPAGMVYVLGSAVSDPPAEVGYFNGITWTLVEPLDPADVQRIRWTLSSPLASGSSGVASFQVTVQ